MKVKPKNVIKLFTVQWLNFYTWDQVTVHINKILLCVWINCSLMCKQYVFFKWVSSVSVLKATSIKLTVWPFITPINVIIYNLQIFIPGKNNLIHIYEYVDRKLDLNSGILYLISAQTLYVYAIAQEFATPHCTGAAAMLHALCIRNVSFYIPLSVLYVCTSQIFYTFWLWLKMCKKWGKNVCQNQSSNLETSRS